MKMGEELGGSASAAAAPGTGAALLASRIAHAVRAPSALRVVWSASATAAGSLLLARPVPLTAEPRLPATAAVAEPAPLPLPLSLRPVADTVAVYFPAATTTPALLPDGEFRLLALGHVSFRTRQLRPHQRAMHRPIVVGRDRVTALFGGNGDITARRHRNRRGWNRDRRGGL